MYASVTEDIDISKLEILDREPLKEDLNTPCVIVTEREGITLHRLWCINRSSYRQQALIHLPGNTTITVIKDPIFPHLYVAENACGVKEAGGRYQSPEGLFKVLYKASKEGRLQYLCEVNN